MPNITLPDGKKLKFEKSITGSEVAEKISIKIIIAHSKKRKRIFKKFSGFNY